MRRLLSFAALLVCLVASTSVCAAGRWEFPGGSGNDFINFVRSHGSGTYVVTGQVNVTSTMTIDVDHVTITANTLSSRWMPIFKISAPNVGIEVKASFVEFNRVSFLAADPQNYSGILVLTRGAQQTRYIECTWEQGKGTALYEEASFATFIRGPHVEGLPNSDGTAFHLTKHAISTTIIGEGYGRGIYNGGIAIYVDDAEGLFVEKLMSFKTRRGLFMNPVADNAIINIVLQGVNFDSTYNYGHPVRVWNGHGNFQVTRLFFENCWMYSDVTGGPAYQFDTPTKQISITGGYAQSDNPAYPEEFVFNSTVDKKIVQNVMIN